MQQSPQVLVGLLLVGIGTFQVAVAQPARPDAAPAPAPQQRSAETPQPPRRPAAMGVAQLQLLEMSPVRQQIGLNPQQDQQRQQLMQQYYQERQRLAGELEGATPQQQQQKLPQLQQQLSQRLEQTSRQIEQLLTADQRSQLQKIEFQLSIYAAMENPAAAEQLKLSDQQKQKLQQVYQQSQEQMWKIQQQAAQQVLDVLSPQQQQQLKDLQTQDASAPASPPQ